VKDPERRKTFKQFVNTDETERGIGLMQDRDQYRPVDWPRDDVPLMLSPLAAELQQRANADSKQWVNMGSVGDFPKDGGATVKYGASQLAVYRFESRNVSFIAILIHIRFACIVMIELCMYCV
jgi:nitrite reductase (NADH) large subunit